MVVGKVFSFEAAHFIPGHPRCGRTHGHSFLVEIVVEGEVNPVTGMVIDFIRLAEIVKPLIDTLDHTNLNNLFSNPTAETICDWFYVELTKRLPTFDGIGVKVRETSTNWASKGVS